MKDCVNPLGMTARRGMAIGTHPQVCSSRNSGKRGTPERPCAWVPQYWQPIGNGNERATERDGNGKTVAIGVAVAAPFRSTVHMPFPENGASVRGISLPISTDAWRVPECPKSHKFQSARLALQSVGVGPMTMPRTAGHPPVGQIPRCESKNRCRAKAVGCDRYEHR